MTLLRDLKIDSVTNDLEINAQGDWDLTTDLAQAVRIRLRFIRGEWFLDANAGMPWFEQVLRRNIDEGQIREAFRTEILATPGIVSLESLTLTLDREARTLAVRFRANGEPEAVVSIP